MSLISVPREDSIIFQRYFETVWNMEANDDWQANYEKQNLIREIMVACGYSSTACFVMLSQAHDIIYDRGPE